MGVRRTAVLVLGLMALASGGCGGDDTRDSGIGAGTGGEAGSGGDAGINAGTGGEAGTGGTSGSGGTGGTSGSGGEGGSEQVPPPMPPAPEAEATCMHESAPQGFEIRAAVVIRGSVNHVVAVADDGTYVELGCDGVDDPRRIFASPGGGELLVNTDDQPFTTSWYIDGVYALPMHVDGFDLSDHRWIADDWIVALGTRRDPSTQEIVEFAPYYMRWDGARLRRAPGRLAADRPPLRLPFGATSDYGVIRVGVTPDGTIDHVRIRLSDGEATVISTDIGGTWVSLYSGVQRDTGNFLIVGDGEGIDRIYVGNANTGEVTETDLIASRWMTITPDGAHAVGNAGTSFRSFPFDNPSQSRSYPGLNYGTVIRMEPHGHRILAFTNDGHAALADPATGTSVMPISPPVAAGAAGVDGFVFANGGGAYMTATLEMGGERGLYFSDFAGHTTQIDLGGSAAPNDVRLQQTGDGRHMAHRTPDGWLLVGRDASPVPIPGLLPDRAILAHAFAGDLLLAESRDPARTTPVNLFAWRVGDTSITDLLAQAIADLDGTHEELDSVVVTYPYEPPLGI